MPASDFDNKKIAIVCDWLVGTGGAERVVLELHKLFPNAPIYTSQYDDDPKKWQGESWFKDADVRTLWLQKLPKSLRKFLPVFRAIAFSRLDLSDYDLVISSSGAEAKAVKTGNAVHIWFCHAPTHYYWSRYESYIKNPGFGKLNPIARLGLKILLKPMRSWDYKAAQKPSHIIANSSHIKEEVKKYYGREAKVIFPPVDLQRFINNNHTKRNGLVTAGRQVPYKNIDLAILACKKLSLPLVVIGSGPEHQKLVDIAGPLTTFIENPTDNEVAEYFKSAESFIFPSLNEDFGITPVEAMAAGTPVVAYKNGGPKDYVNPETGVTFDQHTVDSLAEAINQVLSTKYDPKIITKHARYFSADRFDSEMLEFVSSCILLKK